MLFSNRAPQFPHLATYLDYQRQNPSRRTKQTIPVGAIVSGVLFAALLLGDRLPILKWLAMAVLVAIACWFIYQRSQNLGEKPANTETRLRRDSLDAGELMRAGLQHKRLERDLGEPSVILLDESGRQWGRIQASLAHPFWMSDGLPVHYESVRDQCKRASDSGMNEIIALFRPMLNDADTRRPVMSVVGDAISGLVKKSDESEPNLPPSYGLARDLGEKLKTMADELERVTSSAALDPSTFEQHGAAPALDGAIHDLQNLRRTEPVATDEPPVVFPRILPADQPPS